MFKANERHAEASVFSCENDLREAELHLKEFNEGQFFLCQRHVGLYLRAAGEIFLYEMEQLIKKLIQHQLLSKGFYFFSFLKM